MPATFRRLLTIPLTLCLGMSLVSHQEALAHDHGQAHVAQHQPKSVHAEAKVHVGVAQAWIRPMVKGQTATGGFMHLTAHDQLSLEGFSVAGPGVAELHEMRMDGNVMRMRAIASLPLPAGQMVALKPGGHHLMLVNLPQPLLAGDTVKLTLKLRNTAGDLLLQTIVVPVANHAAPATPHAH